MECERVELRSSAPVSAGDVLDIVAREFAARLHERESALDDMAYAISHDLRAPLRAVVGFSQVLRDEHRAELSPEAGRLVGMIAESARTLAAAIDGFAELFRVGTKPLAPEPVALDALVRTIAAELRAAAEPRDKGSEARFELVVGELPVVEGDPALVRQALRCLLSNAIRFSQRAVSPRIEVTARLEGSVAWIEVTDNGLGFDPRHAAQLFRPLQRLHSTQDFAGLGFGLALVRRIVQRHAGRVGASGRPACGATFGFTIAIAAGAEQGTGS